MKKIIIFIGPPGSGKGTQAKRLAEQLQYGYIATGDIFRVLSTKPDLSPDEKDAVTAMSAGRLVPDATVYRLAFAAAERYFAQGSGIVLDGAIRTLAQARAYQEFFTQKKLADEVLVINIVLSDEAARRRLVTRRICGNCGAIVPAGDSADSAGHCPACGRPLTQRADDADAVVEQRLEEQGNRALKPILEYYKNLGAVSDVDGSRSIEDVGQAVAAIVGV